MACRLAFFAMFAWTLPFSVLAHDLDYYQWALKDEGIQRFFKYKTYTRPQKCPLATTSTREILDQILLVRSALVNGACNQNQQNLIDGLSEIAKNINNKPTASPTPAPLTPQQSLATNTQSVLAGLANLTKDSACLEDIKNKGLLAFIADLATNIGQAAMVVPTPNGILIGSVTITVGATLRVINNLIASPFNFKIEKDRRQFVELNCSFFELRRQLDVIGIFEETNEDRDTQENLGKTLTAELKVKLTNLKSDILDGDEKTQLIGSYEKMIKDLETKTLLIGAIKRKQEMDPYGNSVHMAFDIIQEFKAIQKLIFGKRGWHFFHYLLKEALHNYYHFKSRFKIWSQKKLENEKNPNELQTRWLCRDANQIRKDWEAANYSLELGVEFLDANKGIIHRFGPRFKFFAYIILTGHSAQYHLYKNLKALELAQQALLPTFHVEEKDKEAINDAHWFYRHNIGTIAIKIKSKRPQRSAIEDFIVKNSCLDLN